MSIFSTNGRGGRTAYEALEDGKTWRTGDGRTVDIAEYGDLDHLENIISWIETRRTGLRAEWIKTKPYGFTYASSVLFALNEDIIYWISTRPVYNAIMNQIAHLEEVEKNKALARELEQKRRLDKQLKAQAADAEYLKGLRDGMGIMAELGGLTEKADVPPPMDIEDGLLGGLRVEFDGLNVDEPEEELYDCCELHG